MVNKEPLMVNKEPLMVSLSNHEPTPQGLILRQAQDERLLKAQDERETSDR